MAGFIDLVDAVIGERSIRSVRDGLVDGNRRAIGLACGAGLPTTIPREHFAIAWEQPKRITVTRPPSPTIDDLLINRPRGWRYAEPWLDVANGVIYADDGTPQWTQIRVEAKPTERVPLPDMRVANTRPSRAAAWGLRYLYGKTGYPKNLSIPAITRHVNEALRTDYAPLSLQRRKVSSDTVERLLKPRQ